MAYLDFPAYSEEDDDLLDLAPEDWRDDEAEDFDEPLESDDLDLEDMEDWHEPESLGDILAERRRRRRLPKYRRRYNRSRGRVRTPRRTPQPRFSRTRQIRGGVVRGPAGKSQAVQFRKPVASAGSLDTFKKEVRKAIAVAQDDYRKRFTAIDKRLDTNTATLDKKINVVDGRVTNAHKELKKFQDHSQMSGLLPLLLTKPPEVETITLAGAPAANTPIKAEVKYKKSDDLLLPLLLMSGGLGGGQSSGGMNPAILLLALTK